LAVDEQIYSYWAYNIQLFYITRIHYQKYPAVAQPGRAFGCSSWHKLLNSWNSLSG